MAVSLSTSLLAHQSGPRRRPALGVVASATRSGVEVLHWEPRYAGDEPPDPSACALTAAGTLLRVRNRAGSLEIARTTDPGGSTATFDDWTALATISADTPVAIASLAGETLLLSCSSSGTSIDLRSSSDDGLTWSSGTSIISAASAIGSLAVVFNPSGDACLFYVEGAGTVIKRLRRTAGTWASSGTSWTNAAAVDGITGIGGCHDGADFVLSVTGTEAATLAPRAWTVRMGDGGLPVNLWSALTPIAEADAASSVSFESPAILARDGDFHAFVTRREAGHVPAAATLSTHPLHLAGNASTWTEPAPFRDASGGALAFAGVAAGYAWSASAAAVYRAPVGSAADLTAALLACDWQVTLGAATARLEFNDPDGQLGAEGSLLVPGNSLAMRHGYLSGTGGAPEYGLSLEFTITRVSSVLVRGSRRVRVEAEGPWEQLGRWHSPDSLQAAPSDTRDTIFAWLAARAGVLGAAAGTPLAPPGEWSSDTVAFALTPGESASTALRSLMNGLDVAAVPSAGALTMRGIEAGEAPSWTIGAAGHPITSVERVREQVAGWLRLDADGRYADAFALDAAGSAGVVRDSTATTDALATAHAETVLRRRRGDAPRARLVVPFHAGIEVCDVVTVTDPASGFEEAQLRVIATALRYRHGARGAVYDSLLTLGDV